MTSTADDGEAIRASLDDPGAFVALFDRHYDGVHGFVQRRVGPAVADDIAGETFLRAFESRRRYDVERPNALPWLLGIAVNLLGHHYRSEERQLRAYAKTGVDAIVPPDEGAADRLDAAASRRRLAAALAELRAEERDVLLLYAWGDLDYSEIAQALDIPLGTVRSRLSRGREHIRELLSPEPDPATTP
jgi:RNA polymerase sigma-70 factor, ECF subfamily